jgi:hypothetical protein
MTSSTICRLLVLGLAGVVLAGCASGTERTVASTTTAVTTTATSFTSFASPASTTTIPYKQMDPSALRELKRSACEQGGVFNPDSPPYAGAPPHWAEGYEMSVKGRHIQHTAVTNVGGIRSDTRVPGAGLNVNLNEIQLLACVMPVLGARAGNVTCSFDENPEGVATSRTWPFYEASYQVTVREARTGRQITVLTVPGNRSPKESCPHFATDYPDAVVARSLTEDALGEAMRPLIFGAA